MHIQSINNGDIADRFRCYLSTLYVDESATIYWDQHSFKTIEPFNKLVTLDRSSPFNSTIRQISETICHTQDNSFCLYEHTSSQIRSRYLRLKNKYLQPKDNIQRLVIPGFHIGFQLSDDMVHHSIFKFLSTVHYPVFVATNSLDIADRVSKNPNVRIFDNAHKYDMSKEWTWSFIELLTMAGCRTLYVTPKSSYGEMAYLFGDYKPIIRDCSQRIHLVDSNTLQQPELIV